MKMLSSFLLFFNVFILLVYSSPQDRKINEKLERQNGTINEYVDCKINNLNANHGLTIRFYLNELDSLLLERQAVVLLSTNCLYERHKQ
uniref:Hypotheticial protein n=1 Tax=Schistosoma japonicum TaxID=6182 RepID=C1LIK1_SCHJA|nr:hypotheticial protein [Schistosoma japonicum]